VRPKLSFGAARPVPHGHLRRRASLATDEREQKPEQHLEIAALQPPPYDQVALTLVLDTARRFTEAASTLQPMRHSSIRKVLVCCNVR
jgi:hypothetical protein